MRNSRGALFFAALALAGAFSGGAAPAAAESPCLSVADSMLNVKSYEAVLVMSRGSSVVMSGTVDIARPSSVAVHSKNMDMIGIGNQGWMRMNGGAWQKSPMAALGSLASMDPRSFMKSPKNGTCVDAGMGFWHGQAAHIYKGTYTTPKGDVDHSTMYVMGDGYVHHMEFASMSGVRGSFDFSKFNAVTISPP